MNFYERRARRILPALFFIMLVSVPFAWMWMAPSQMQDYSLSLVAVSLFVSNILFWRESGYFDTAVEEKPFLHTWSLAVEEQYYLLFPIFLILFWRFGKNRVFWMIVLIAVISLILSEWGSRNKVNANFYLAPTRAWELFAGSITAFIIQKHGVQENSKLAFLGLAAIFLSIFAYDETIPFPSLYAMVPVLGVVLLLVYAGTNTLAAKLLGTKLLVGVGLISYSAYLWHQPLFAFARIRNGGSQSDWVMLALAFTSILLAFFSWRYIEKPFREAHSVGRRQIFYLSAVLVTFTCMFGFFGYKSNGFEAQMLKFKYTEKERGEVTLVLNAVRYDMYKEMANSKCKIWVTNTDLLDVEQIEDCKQKFGKAIFVLGDSHAMNLFNIFSYSKAYPFIIGVSQGGCRPHNNYEKCHYNNFDDFVKDNRGLIELIVYHQSGSYFVKDKYSRVDSQDAFTGNFLGYETSSIHKVNEYLKSLRTILTLKLFGLARF